MGIDDNTGIGKLLASHLHAIMRIAQNTHDSDHTVSNSVLALNRQIRYHLFIFYISLDSYDGGQLFPTHSEPKEQFEPVHTSEHSLKDIVMAIRVLLRGECGRSSPVVSATR